MLNIKFYFALAAAIAVLPVSFSKVANAQVGYAGQYGGYYPIPGGHNMAPLPSGRRSSSRSVRTYAGEYRFECEERLGYWKWEKRSEQYPFNSPGDEYCNAMKERIKRSCRSLPNPQ
jgi:hypothetical protein